MEKLVEKDLKSEILKQDIEKRLITGVVLEPEVEDSQGDVISEDEIEAAAHNFMIMSRQVGLQHTDSAPAKVVESYIAPERLAFGEQIVRKGAWLMTVKVMDDDIWEQVKNGDFTGFSVGGFANRQ